MKPLGVGASSGNWLFSITPGPIFRYPCAALDRATENRPGAHATITRSVGNRRLMAATRAMRSLSAETRIAVSNASRKAGRERCSRTTLTTGTSIGSAKGA
jgi:hypothetical protein